MIHPNHMRSFFSSIVFTTGFAVLAGWVLYDNGVYVAPYLLHAPEMLAGRVWLGVSANTYAIVLNFIAAFTVCGIIGVAFFRMILASWWSAVAFVVALIAIDPYFALQFFLGFGIALALDQWMEGNPPFEIDVTNERLLYESEDDAPLHPVFEPIGLTGMPASGGLDIKGRPSPIRYL